jgi:rfaE bifunctional protein nucleotidyltransferase chain/domain
MRAPQEKIRTLEEAARWAADLQSKGLRLAVTNGVFDLLHRGHAEYLAQARRQADCLLVAINSDESVRALKGPERPIVCLEDRAFILASLECVDCVVSFNGTKALDVFSVIRPDVYVKGGDYTEDTLDREEYALLKRGNPRFCFIPFVEGHSTTGVINGIRQKGPRG